MLQRIYGTAFASEEDLDAYLNQIEEAEKRDHRRLGREMDLFHFQEEAPGAVFWHPKGWALFQALIGYMRRRQQAWGYRRGELTRHARPRAVGAVRPLGEVRASTCSSPRRRTSAIYCLQADELPGPCADLQARAEELSRSAVAHGRVRHGASLRAVGRAARPDARARTSPRTTRISSAPRSRSPTNACGSTSCCCRSIAISASRTCAIKFADRPDKRVGTDAVGTRPRPRLKRRGRGGRPDHTTSIRARAPSTDPSSNTCCATRSAATGSAARSRSTSNMPERLGAFYIGAGRREDRPVMLHRAMFGSLERFIGILIEHYAGHLPLWLAPVQAVVAHHRLRCRRLRRRGAWRR